MLGIRIMWFQHFGGGCPKYSIKAPARALDDKYGLSAEFEFRCKTNIHLLIDNFFQFFPEEFDLHNVSALPVNSWNACKTAYHTHTYNPLNPWNNSFESFCGQFSSVILWFYNNAIVWKQLNGLNNFIHSGNRLSWIQWLNCSISTM